MDYREKFNRINTFIIQEKTWYEIQIEKETNEKTKEKYKERLNEIFEISKLIKKLQEI